MKKILFLLALVIASPAEAATWKLVAKSNTTRAWIDVDTIKRGSEAVGGWYRISLPKGEWATGFAAFKCESKLYMELRLTFYEANGSSTNMDDRLKKEWEMPVPDSIMDGIVDGICAE
jgi:hypothetical protein